MAMTESEAQSYGHGKRSAAFAKWRNEVDVELVAICGMVGDDLPDWCYADAFEDDMSPKQAAREVLQEAGW